MTSAFLFITGLLDGKTKCENDYKQDVENSRYLHFIILVASNMTER